MTLLNENPTIKEVVEHFGTKGMHWGVRKSGASAGVSRSSGALIDRNARQKRVLEDAASGKKYKMQVAVGKKIIGEDQWKINMKHSISSMNAQDKRLKAGKQNFGDRIDKYANINVGSLLVSRTPR